MDGDPTVVKTSFSEAKEDDLELGRHEGGQQELLFDLKDPVPSVELSPEPPPLPTGTTPNSKQQTGHGAIPVGPAGALAQLPDYKDQVRSAKPQELPRRRLPDFKDQVRPPPQQRGKSRDSGGVGEEANPTPFPTNGSNDPEEPQRTRDNNT